MGVDISHIIKHNFRQVSDRKAARRFVDQTKRLLRDKLLMQSVGWPYETFYDKSSNEKFFRLPVYNVEFYLHNGFWQIESYHHYCQIMYQAYHDFYLRRLCFDLANVLGQDEAWYAEEYYTWNGYGCEEPETTFEEWHERAVTQYGHDIPEFDQSAFLSQRDAPEIDYEPIYHDSFAECKLLFQELQERLKLKDYRLLGLSRIGNDFLRCDKDGKLSLVREFTLKPLSIGTIDGLEDNLNGPEFVVVQNGLSAVFDGEGKQLTDFVKGKFEWERIPDTIHSKEAQKSNHTRYIINEKAHIKFEV